MTPHHPPARDPARVAADAVRVSVVVPLHNEAENVPGLVSELQALHDHVPGLELLLVDDGSTDETWAAIQQAARQVPGLRGLHDPVNRGQSSALLTGLRAARGAIVVTLDGDLQNDPADIPAMLQCLDGCDAVCGWRTQRQDSWSRRTASRLANAIRLRITHDGMHDTGCSLKVFRRELVGDLPALDGVHRFMPAYFVLHGRRLLEMPVHHRPRRHGVSKYTNLKRLPRTLYDLFGFRWYRRRHLRLAGDGTVNVRSI